MDSNKFFQEVTRRAGETPFNVFHVGEAFADEGFLFASTGNLQADTIRYFSATDNPRRDDMNEVAGTRDIIQNIGRKEVMIGSIAVCYRGPGAGPVTLGGKEAHLHRVSGGRLDPQCR